jgi:hypothetical protein
MATNTDKSLQPTNDDRLTAVLEQLASLQQQQADNAPFRKVSYAEWLEKNPERKLPFPLHQNGFRISDDQVTDEQKDLLPKLKVGRFFDRRIHVYRDSTPDRGWHITYPCKSLSDRMVINGYARDFTELLQRLTTETPDLT